MAIQTVPYALQNASHSAALFRQSASAPFATGGILGTGELAVSQQASPNMSVILGPGRAKVAGTSVSPPSGFTWTTQAMYDVLNDANLTLTVAASNPTNPRIDAVYVQVQDSFYSGTNNQAIAGIVAGTPAPSPSAPAVPTNAILIGYIAVAANATAILTANISYQATLPTLVNVVTASNAGLTRVVPVAPVNGTVSLTGLVSFTAAASVSLNNIFTSAHNRYLIEYVIQPSGSVALRVRVRSAGADLSTANYQRVATLSSGSASLTSQTSLDLGNISGPVNHISSLEIANPLAPTNGQRLRASVDMINTSSAATTNGVITGWYTAASNFDGLTFFPDSGTITGTIAVYAYNDI